MLSFMWQIQAWLPRRGRLRLVSLSSVILMHVPYFKTDSVTCYNRTMPVFKFKHVPECLAKLGLNPCHVSVWADNKTSLACWFFSLFTPYPSTRAGRSDFEGFLTHHQRLQTCSLRSVHLCWGLWAGLSQPLFHKLSLRYQSSLCNVKTNVNDQGMTGNCKAYRGQSFPFQLRVLLCLGSPGSPGCRGCSCTMLYLLLGIIQWQNCPNLVLQLSAGWLWRVINETKYCAI